MMRTAIGLCCWAVISCLAGVASAQSTSEQPASSFVLGDPLEGRRIAQMAVVGDQLWLRLDDGALIAMGLEMGARRTAAETGVVDMAQRGGELLLLTSRGTGLAIEALVNGKRRVIVELPPPGAGRSSSVYGAKGKVVVVSELVTRAGGAPSRAAPVVQIYDDKRRSWHSVTAVLPPEVTDRENLAWVRWVDGRRSGDVTCDGRFYYLGVNRGEWGGDLYRIDLADGAMARVALADDGNVQDVQQDSLRDDCVIVSTALAHMGGLEGSLRRVCPGETTLLVSRPVTSGLGLPGFAPIHRFAAMKAGYWFMSSGSAFEADERGENVRPVTTEFEPFGGLMIDKHHPGVVLVKYDAASPSPDRYYPLVAAR